MSKFVLIGGGENGHHNTQYETGIFDKEIVGLTGKKHPQFLFIGFANPYADDYYEVMKGIYGGMYQCATEHLTERDTADNAVAQAKIQKADIIYVGGGDTLALMKKLGASGVDEMLVHAAGQDKVLCGVSAGAMCWCRYGQADSEESGPVRATGLGLVDLLFCPHILTEPKRGDYLKDTMKQVQGIPAVALDMAALEIVDDTYRILYPEHTARADRCYWKDGKYHEESIKSEKWRRLLDLLKIS